MLRERSKLWTYYLNSTLKDILKIGHKKRYKILSAQKEVLDPSTIPKYKSQLDKPCVYHPITVKCKKGLKKSSIEHVYFIDISEFDRQILPDGFPKTRVIGCGGLIKGSKNGGIKYARSFPGGTFDAVRHIPVCIKWKNRLSFPVRMYLHGGERPKACDEYQVYNNDREPAAYWYYSRKDESSHKSLCFGARGFYILGGNKSRLKNNLGHIDLPGDKYVYPLIIQDCSFYSDGSFAIPGDDDLTGKGFFGNAIMVNGTVWPNLNVERRQYRFYILNGSVSRFYNLKLSNGMNVTLLGGDRGLLPSPAKISEILLAPGERADVLVDFSKVPAGTEIILANDAKAPYPDGDMPDHDTTGQIMRFTVPIYEILSIAPLKLPEKLYEKPKELSGLTKKIHTIHEKTGAHGPVLLFDGKECFPPVIIQPDSDKNEEWYLVNLTQKAYPVHIAGAKFRIISRQKLDTASFIYKGKEILKTDDLSPYLLEKPVLPKEHETGWKDTLRVDPDMVTRIVIFPLDR